MMNIETCTQNITYLRIVYIVKNQYSDLYTLGHLLHLAEHPDYYTVSNQVATDQGLPYDFRSIMHYEPECSAIDADKPSMLIRHVPTKYVGEDDGPTCFDYLHINLLYCKGNLTHTVIG